MITSSHPPIDRFLIPHSLPFASPCWEAIGVKRVAAQGGVSEVGVGGASNTLASSSSCGVVGGGGGGGGRRRRRGSRERGREGGSVINPIHPPSFPPLSPRRSHHPRIQVPKSRWMAKGAFSRLVVLVLSHRRGGRARVDEIVRRGGEQCGFSGGGAV
ncbi:hypothetical protein BCR35DRAFT_308914 [Leucosporidium creatinivorum]|uniref:Uncharacterized protein n=1 Tax=Leucosporidium creatinivorum TaxID=106004 RepID=A0A1Y2DUC5_9BASI|nr:hypothetical protein BCR35DRAFT_308914 [Leucosporidium creatinivorum]